MSTMENLQDANKSIGDNENCRLCGLQSYEVLPDKSKVSLGKIENCPCFVKTVIAFLHEKILGCQVDDKSTRPKVSLSLNNEICQSQKFQDLKEQHNICVKSSFDFTELAVYRVKPSDKFKLVNTVDYKYIDIEKDFKTMISNLLKCSEVAVNIEYYSAMSYLGFTWLLQISTTETNYFVNCLNLETLMPVLNDVFMNKNILKIFYNGKDSILKLQKDFGIFFMNIFDIQVIEKILKKPKNNKLVEKFDLFYRSFADSKHTYLLLYIKDYLTTLLLHLKKDHILQKLCTDCREICVQEYQQPKWNDISVFENLGSKRASCQEIYIIGELLQWRNDTAKKEDIAPNLILPDYKILNCAKELLRNGYSETLDRYHKVKCLKNERIKLNTDEIVNTARRNSTKNRHIADHLRCSETADRSLVPTVPKPAQQETNSQGLLSLVQKDVAILASNDNVLQQELNKDNETLSVEVHVKKSNLSQKAKKKKKNSHVSRKKGKKNIAVAVLSDDNMLKKEVNNDEKKKISSVQLKVKKSNLLYKARILKPQLRFKDKIDNICPIWKPSITEKPNALVPLDLYIVNQFSTSRYCHPYKTELQHFSVPKSQLVENTPIPIRQIEETPLHYIKTTEELGSLCSHLKNHNELAVGLMYNKKRSYAGYTSLLLISTRDSDYIIDALALRAKLKILNSIFADPKILKVFHNCANKLLWLQKDLGLYVVNMFDVARTDMISNKKVHNLPHLKRYVCDIKFKKQKELPREMKDWRVRSLSHKVKEYLRNDTHSLLYIKDILSNKLCCTDSSLKIYYDYCTTLCKNVYKKPSFNVNCYKDILCRKNIKDKYAGHTVRIDVLKELNRLRHMIARCEDENPDDILSEKVLLKLVDLLPHDQERILDLWNYDKKKKYVHKVTSIIFAAKYIKFKTKNNDDYRCILESENYTNEVVKKEIENEKETRFNNERSILTLGDFISSKKIDNEINEEKKNSRSTHNSKTCFQLMKRHRWDHTRNIGDWLDKWIGQFWPGKYYVKEINDSTIMINVFFKKYKDIIWMKRDQIHYEEGTIIRKLLSGKDLRNQQNLTNAAKDFRDKGLPVKIRQLAIKVEDKWYEWKENVGLHEISEEEVRKRGVDTDL